MRRYAGAGTGGIRLGIVFIVAAFALFSLHDAAFKLVVIDYSVSQILFIRSVMVILACLAMRAARPGAVPSGPTKLPQMIGRSLILLAGWALYYTAAKTLPLAELTTLYYAAPLIVVVLSAVFLREKVPRATWAAIGLGFAGVAITSGIWTIDLSAGSTLALAAACLWAVGTVLLRHLSLTQSTAIQMLVSNTVFAIGTLPFVALTWRPPDMAGWLAITGIGALGALAQLLLIESLRRAPASVIAPFEYTALIWAFLLQYLIWHEPPSVQVLAGGAAIVISSLMVVVSSRRHRDESPPAKTALEPAEQAGVADDARARSSAVPAAADRRPGHHAKDPEAARKD